MRPERKVVLLICGLIATLIFMKATEDTCVRAWIRYGVDVPICPDGDVHVSASIDANNLRRGQKGLVTIGAQMLYAVPHSIHTSGVTLESVDAVLSLHGPGVKETEKDKGEPVKLDEKDVSYQGPGRAGWVTLRPDLPDGDYLLRAHVKTRAGETTVDAPLAVYAPAKIHVLTDRPLYEPGHTVKMRAVVLRARDLVPLDGRPGKWVVTDPTGITVLEEKAPAGDFGVVEGELPLDKSSPEGTWRISYVSGNASDAVTIDVRPFTLPRFNVDVAPAKPFYRAKDEPRVTVRVANAAGLPVVADVDLEWRVDGAWPAPPSFTDALPKTTKTDRTGRAELTLPRVPADLVGKVRIGVTASARDDTGDQEIGGGTILLSEDAIDIAAVTEFEGGLVDGLNNRMYLRATTASGVPLDRVTLTVTRAWDRTDKGTTIETDEDGVAAMQIDPGPAVTVVIPAMPVRLPPPRPVVERTSLSEALTDREPSLADIAAIDRWNGLVAPCARFVESHVASVNVQLRVEPSGAVARAAAPGDLGRCVAGALRGARVAPGDARLFEVEFQLRPTLASLEFDVVGGALPESIERELERATLDARTCLGPLTVDRSLPRIIVWDVVDNTFSGAFARDPMNVEDPLDAGRTSCIESRMASFVRTRALPKRPAASDDDEDTNDALFGAIRFNVVPVSVPGQVRSAGPTTMLGYELRVSAKGGDEDIGQTKLRIAPGQVPAIRLRASNVIADAGKDVTIEILRGPSFTGELPKKLTLTHADGASIEADVDKEKRAATFKLPSDKDGWYEARFDSGVARILVMPSRALSVDLKPNSKSYKPGEMAKLAVTTKEADAGVSAAVGLFGVDATLEKLAPLAGPDAMERVLPTVDMQRKAFDVLDATALTLGRIRGKHAAAATVLLVSRVPTPEEIDASVNASASTVFDPLLPLADRFYTVLEALYGEVRAFEANAPKDEKLTPQKMLGLWDDALTSASKQGAVTTDAFGRKLKLDVLPDELVALTDPRLVVADGTRLPEDVEAWVRFVRLQGSES